MKNLGWGLLGLVAGYAVGVLAGVALVAAFSGNAHDKNVEAAVTAAFVTGPIGAAIGLLLGLAISRRSSTAQRLDG